MRLSQPQRRFTDALKSYLQIPDYSVKKNKFNNVVVNILDNFTKYNEEIIRQDNLIVVHEDRVQEIFDYMYQDLKSVVAFGYPENGLCLYEDFIVAETSHRPPCPYAYFSQYPYESTLTDMMWLNENF